MSKIGVIIKSGRKDIMNNKSKAFLISAGALCGAVAAVSAVSYAVTNKLVEIALERDSVSDINDMKKAKEQISGSEELSEIVEMVNQRSKALEESGCERIEITSYDGISLVGHLKRAEDAKRIIIAMHGWRSCWSFDFACIADFWAENGCTVLFVEQRGQGESGGEYMGFGLIERYDCLEWIKWVNESVSSNLPVYLAGVSMGAATVLMATGLELPQNVHGVMADCAFTSPRAIWKHVAEKNLRLSYGVIGKIANDMCRKRIQMDTDGYSTLEALETNKIPVLFVHGTDDSFVPIEMTYENYKACKAPRRLLVVPGADHGMSFLVDTDGYKNAVISFWKDFDKTPLDE